VEIAMCMACEEMQLYYAYLDAVEEQKRKAQPWQCEVTLIAPAMKPAPRSHPNRRSPRSQKNPRR
jgi:hypothetical protein